MKNTLSISVEAFSERYLGLPTAVGRITSCTFDILAKDKEVRCKGGLRNTWRVLPEKFF
jgi:hypothetical protein